MERKVKKMNNQRRKEIKNVICKLETVKEEINRILDDEQDYYDNMPENLQNSIRGMDSDEAISNLNDAMDAVDTAVDSLGMIN
jgi:flagellar biosynthesis chaperone FliJ